MELEQDAPVVASSEAEIAAPVAAAWDTITDFASWPDWNPDVRFVEFAGEVEPGTQFRWKAGPPITSTLEEVEAPTRIAWSGRTFGVRAVHIWSFEPRGDHTLARTEESWSGFLPRLIRRPLSRTLQKSLDEGLTRLASEAERRAARP